MRAFDIHAICHSLLPPLCNSFNQHKMFIKELCQTRVLMLSAVVESVATHNSNKAVVTTKFVQSFMLVCHTILHDLQGFLQVQYGLRVKSKASNCWQLHVSAVRTKWRGLHKLDCITTKTPENEKLQATSVGRQVRFNI